MPCYPSEPAYIPAYQRGLRVVNAEGDGYSMYVYWHRAYPSQSTYEVLYNIYYSAERDAIWDEPKFLASTADLYVIITDLVPGELYYFAVRAAEYDPDWFLPGSLPSGGTNLYVYPETLLATDITSDSTVIPCTDVSSFPDYGVLKIGAEWIRYSSRDSTNNYFLGGTRGFLGTNARYHNTDGYDGYATWDPIVKFFYGLEENNKFVNQKANTFQQYDIFTQADGYKVRNSVGILSTDLSSSDADRVDFPSYDYDGWHRTDPALLFQGKCLDTYIGGEHGCADGYLGVGRTIRNLSLSEHADRREEMLIQQTGEEVVLASRLWSGTVCSCYEPGRESPESRCPRCFPAGTLVRTDLGYRPIEEIHIGDMVLTDDGSFQRVSNVFSNEFDGHLIGVMPTVSANMIWSTPEHPYLAMKGSHDIDRGCGPKCNTIINNGNGFARNMDIRPLRSGNWHARGTINEQRCAIGTFVTQEFAIQAITQFRLEHPGHVLAWEEAKNLSTKSWLTAKWPQNIVDVDTITIPSSMGHNHLRNGVDTFKVDEEFLWMIGIYLAEGSSGKRVLNFALHKKEQSYANRIMTFFSKYGYNSTKIEDRDGDGYGMVVGVFSTTLALWFTNLLGRGCQNKHIPEQLMYLPVKKQRSLLQGIYDGDGIKRENNIVQTSPILALQMAEILHRIGEQPLINPQQSNQLTPLGNVRKLAYSTNWAESTFTHVNRKGRWLFEDQMLTKIRSVEKKKFSGTVYNLEVERQNTFVVQGVVVHNCTGTGFLGGYTQYYNPRISSGRILVRFAPYTDDLKQEDSGLESHVIHDCWTLVVPTIKDRDFIIRFNEDGTEEFRYEVLDVTRNKLLYGESGKQNFKAQRVRKTDPICTWRAFRNTATRPESILTTVGIMRGPAGTIIPHTHSVVVNEHINVISQINQSTGISNDHQHSITNGSVEVVLGHSHSLIL